MIWNYAVVAARGLRRDKVYTALNVLGLAVGMACCLLVATFVRHEISYDAQHTRGDRIYRVLRETRDANGVSRFSDGTSGPLAAAMQAEIPEVELAARAWDHWVSVMGGREHLSRTLAVVDPAFFEIFDYELIAGSMKALEGSGGILLTEGSARAFFGDGGPVGRPVRIEGDQGGGDYTVAGVIREPAHNTTVWFDLITTHPPDGWYRPQWEDWLAGGWRMTTDYVLLREGADPEEVSDKLRPMLGRFLGPQLAETDTYHLQSLPRTHLYSEVDFGTRSDHGITQVYAYAGTAGLVLLIACVNFVNLSTARSTRRAREVGVRKVTGALRTQLVAQFLGEATFLALLSFAVAVLFVHLAQGVFNQLIGMMLEPDWQVAAAALPIAAIIGLLAGAYPALVLSRPQPATVLKGMDSTPQGSRLRKGLVVFQFAASVVFVVLAMTVHGQLAFIENQPLGYDDENVVVLSITNRKEELYAELDHLKQMLLDHPNVIAAAGLNGWGLMRPGAVTVHEVGRDSEHAFHQIGTDPDCIPALGMSLTQGRNFNWRTSEAVVNKAAVKAMGWDDPIGKQFEWPGEVGPLTVVGVVEDFHFQSMRDPIGPVAMYHMWWAGQLNVRIKATDVATTIDHLRDVCVKLAPEYPFEYQFLDEEIQKSYRADRRAAKLAAVSAGLSGVVACLGLLGLAAFATERRRREISIRRILGATATQVVGMLSREFLILVLGASLLAWPLAYALAQNWLEAFAYRIDLGIRDLALTVTIALVLGVVAVAGHTLKAVWASPVEGLRDG